ncbi:MAG: DUF3794 domain-containing protein [Oscillospiraceae bacterium]|nr:DUF3794 domain-containing protein [Oscillospiraceae bacterium]
MEIQRDNVKVERLISEANEQTVVDGEVALPGGIRDEAHILHTEARLSLEDAEVLTDRIQLNGNVVFQILYTQGDNRPRALEASSAFTHQISLPGIDAHSRVQTFGQVLEARSQAVSGRLLLHAALSLAARALERTEISYITGIDSVTTLETKTEEGYLMQHVGEAAVTHLLREEFDLPATLSIQETLYARAYPYVKNVSAVGGRAAVQGELSIDAYHASQLQDKPLVVTRHSMPFDISLEVGASDGEDVEVRVALKDIAVSSVDAGEGARLLRAEGLIGVTGIASVTSHITTLSDAYTLSGDDVTLVKESITILSNEVASQSVQSGKIVIELPEGTPPVRSVLAAFIEPTVADSHALGERERIAGVLNVTVVYLPFGGDAPVSAAVSTPFEALFQGALPDGSWIKIESQEIDASAITSDRVELTYRLCMDADAYELTTSELPVDAQPKAVAASRDGIVVVYPSKGESLWDIAHKYRVTQDSISQVNPNMKSVTAGKPVLVLQRQRA